MPGLGSGTDEETIVVMKKTESPALCEIDPAPINQMPDAARRKNRIYQEEFERERSNVG